MVSTKWNKMDITSCNQFNWFSRSTPKLIYKYEGNFCKWRNEYQDGKVEKVLFRSHYSEYSSFHKCFDLEATLHQENYSLYFPCFLISCYFLQFSPLKLIEVFESCVHRNLLSQVSVGALGVPAFSILVGPAAPQRQAPMLFIWHVAWRCQKYRHAFTWRRLCQPFSPLS